MVWPSSVVEMCQLPCFTRQLENEKYKQIFIGTFLTNLLPLNLQHNYAQILILFALKNLLYMHGSQYTSTLSVLTV